MMQEARHGWLLFGLSSRFFFFVVLNHIFHYPFLNDTKRGHMLPCVQHTIRYCSGVMTQSNPLNNLCLQRSSSIRQTEKEGLPLLLFCYKFWAEEFREEGLRCVYIVHVSIYLTATKSYKVHFPQGHCENTCK